MKILITGGLGFIGGRLGIHLSKNGHEVVLGSRRNTNPPAWLPSAKMTVTEWESVDSLKKACLGADLVIHAAGMNAKDCELDPIGALEFNGHATCNLLEAAISASVKTFFYISTAHVYSNPLQGVIDENTLAINSHPYATSHLMGERAVNNAKEEGLINSTVLRLSNAYGAPASPEANCWMLLVNDLCMQAVTTRHLRLNTSGIAQRNFMTLSDVCTAINELIYKSESQILPPMLNICNAYSNTAHEMAIMVQDRCLEVLGYAPDIQLNNEHPSEVNNSLDLKSQYSYLYKGFMKDDWKAEMDELLYFCKKFSFENYPQFRAN
jgi:UDP-glucose 4-epimerase